ncbi:N-Terminal Kinase-Like Protein [Manis pentadactyla]|nr:N-Terminal Kinase-Like Protein [Manis pentadactyla]
MKSLQSSWVRHASKTQYVTSDFLLQIPVEEGQTVKKLPLAAPPYQVSFLKLQSLGSQSNFRVNKLICLREKR